jgi:hypothetical protein
VASHFVPFNRDRLALTVQLVLLKRATYHKPVLWRTSEA